MNGFNERIKLGLKNILFHSLSKVGLWRFLIKKSKTPKILMYHRLTDCKVIPGIELQTFEWQLQFLCKHYQVVSVEEINDDIKNNCIRANKIAITFDDGYVDFYEKAWPLLKKYNVPASIYITTDFIDKKIWMWPDKIRQLLRETRCKALKLPSGEKLLLTETDFDKNWNLIADYCLGVSELKRESYLVQLSSLLNVALSNIPPNEYSSLTWEQLSEMHQEGLDIGSHTLTHPILTNIHKEQLRCELLESKQMIETKLEAEVAGICYPNGMSSDVSVAVTKAAKNCGYSYGLIAYSENEPYQDEFRIDRISASNNMPTFAFSLLSFI
ncbi:MAG: peptidoglycan/xylan/chitin deacetylase (PgdA/CDA1 family) [bacterium]|jgi:peptidoglycan/xylan/chitin deacetylase (PgdA/CDA1 family)